MINIEELERLLAEAKILPHLHPEAVEACMLAVVTALPELIESRKALEALVKRMLEIHDDEKFKSVWMVHQLHVGMYSGPTYTKELSDAYFILSEGVSNA